MGSLWECCCKGSAHPYRSDRIYMHSYRSAQSRRDHVPEEISGIDAKMAPNPARAQAYLEMKKSQYLAEEAAPLDLNCDLKIEIHPCFSRDKFARRIDWRAIEAAARLATHLLYCPSLNRYHYTWLRGAPSNRRYQETGSRIGKILFQTDLCDLAAELEEISHMIEYKVSSKHDDYACRPTTRPNASFFPRGSNSIIFIGREKYNKLIAALESSDMPCLRYRQFELAVALVHELTHAIMNAKFGGDQTWEPYWGNAAVAESGFELESRLFDGRIGLLYEDGTVQEKYQIRRAAAGVRSGRITRRDPANLRNARKSALRGVLVKWEWPDRAMVEMYSDDGLTIDFDPERLPERDLAWRVPLSHIGQFFRKAFWQRASRNPRLLHPPKTQGYLFEYDRDTAEIHPISSVLVGLVWSGLEGYTRPD